MHNHNNNDDITFSKIQHDLIIMSKRLKTDCGGISIRGFLHFMSDREVFHSHPTENLM